MAIERSNGDSFIHRLDPRTKLLLTTLFTFQIFLVNNPAVSAIQLLFFLIICFISRIPIKKIFPHAKLLVFLIFLVVVLQTLFGRDTPDSRYLLKPLIPDNSPVAAGYGSLKLDGLFTGIMISCRLLSLSVLLPVMAGTTEPRLLAYGITRLGMNYKAAYIITSTLNLIPLFQEEARHIMDACRLRGMTVFDRGGFFSRMKQYPSLAFPLIIKAMKRASAIGCAMDARAFGAHKTRTWILQTRPAFSDYSAFAAGISFFVIAVTVNYTFR